jgi:hypothetical protein
MAALIPLNTFRLILTSLPSGSTAIYTAPVGVSTIMLSAHIANVTESLQRVTVKLEKSGSQITMVKNAAIPADESFNPFSGRVVLEEGNKFILETSSSGSLEVSLSVLENANN